MLRQRWKGGRRSQCIQREDLSDSDEMNEGDQLGKREPPPGTPGSVLRLKQKPRSDHEDWEQQEDTRSFQEEVLQTLAALGERLGAIEEDVKGVKELMKGYGPRMKAVEDSVARLEGGQKEVKGEIKSVKVDVEKVQTDARDALSKAISALGKAGEVRGDLAKQIVELREMVAGTTKCNTDLSTTVAELHKQFEELKKQPRTFAGVVGGEAMQDESMQDGSMRRSQGAGQGSAERTVSQALKEEQREHGCTLKLKGFVDEKLSGMPLLQAVRDKLSDMVGTRIVVSSAVPVRGGKVKGCVKVQLGSYQEFQAVWRLGKKGEGYKLGSGQQMWQWYGRVEIAVRSQLYEEAKGKDDMWVHRTILKKREGGEGGLSSPCLCQPRLSQRAWRLFTGRASSVCREAMRIDLYAGVAGPPQAVRSLSCVGTSGAQCACYTHAHEPWVSSRGMIL